MYSIVSTASINGMSSMMVQVEADICNGLPTFEMVGYLASEVREARERIRAAIRNSGFSLPPRRVTVNLCPADVRKSGTGFDLPIALAVLAAYGFVDSGRLREATFIGEIALSGELRPVCGILPMALAAREAGFRLLVVPKENMQEACLVEGMRVFAADSLKTVLSFLLGEGESDIADSASFSLEKNESDTVNPAHYIIEETGTAGAGNPAGLVHSSPPADFSAIHGQYMLRRACEIAAAGMHNLLMVGPPGAGKTLAAHAIPSILPELSKEEMLELAGIYSVAGLFEERKRDFSQRPFRCPHHSVTSAALVGGGRVPAPGEITLAHKGVLFLDELTEYDKSVLEQLRQPLEERLVRLVRVSGMYCYPADFMLVAAMNPCECGYYPDRNKCTCTEQSIRQHLRKISRPLLDRMDLTVEVPKVKLEELEGKAPGESSDKIRERVERARELQRERFDGEAFSCNGRITPEKLPVYCAMDKDARSRLSRAYEEQDLSARGYHKVIRVARTIADLDGSGEIRGNHMMEALLYRSMDAAFRGIGT